jgi:hypothetical protein
MRTSSARQLEFDYQQGATAVLPASPPTADANASGPLIVPNFSVSNRVYAATSRIAGRLNAASITEEEHQSLLRERQALLDKKLGGTITRREENRLQYVRWSLDRVEDAKYGRTLDALEDRVRAYEQFLSDIQGLQAQLAQHMPQRRQRRR